MIARDDVRRFLEANQPLGADRCLPEATIERYDEVRRYLVENPDADCLVLFLGAFGDGDGLGMYTLAADVVRAHAQKDVDMALAAALTSTHRSVRYWNAQLAAQFPSRDLVAPLFEFLREDDHDLKYAALTALEETADADDAEALGRYMNAENDAELQELAREIVTSLKGRRG